MISYLFISSLIFELELEWDVLPSNQKWQAKGKGNGRIQKGAGGTFTEQLP